MKFEKAQPLRRLAGNDTQVFFVGDLHGEYDELMQSLNAAGFDFERDQLICVGDLIDRGPKSDQCLNLLDEPWFHAVIGNHELMMIDALSNPENGIMFRSWIRNGGRWVLENNLGLDDLTERARKASRMMPQAIEVDLTTSAGDTVRVGVVHSEVTSGHWPYLNRFEDAWDRGRFTDEADQYGLIEGIDAVVVGHSIVPEAIWHQNVLNIDTGAFTEDGALTLLRGDQVLGNAFRRVA